MTAAALPRPSIAAPCTASCRHTAPRRRRSPTTIRAPAAAACCAARSARDSSAATAARPGSTARNSGTPARPTACALPMTAPAARWSRAGNTAGRWCRTAAPGCARLGLRCPSASSSRSPRSEETPGSRAAARTCSTACARMRRWRVTQSEYAYPASSTTWKNTMQIDHRGRAAEPRKNLLCDQWLDQEQQERAAEDGAGKQKLDAGVSHAGLHLPKPRARNTATSGISAIRCACTITSLRVFLMSASAGSLPVARSVLRQRK